MSDDIRAAMATRDLMSATQTLCDLPNLDAEYDDIVLTYKRLGKLLHDSMRNMRLRSHGHPKTTSGPLAVREVSPVGELERHRA